MARLLVCAVPLFLFAAGTASAEPDIPRLVRTNPLSSAEAPATSLTPSIIGEAEPGVVIESYPLRLLSAGEGTENPGFEIQIFNGAGCSGAPVGTGTAATFEATGIPLVVAADSATPFSAKQVDPNDAAHPSDCSGTLTYWEGNVVAAEAPGEESAGGGSGGQPSVGGAGSGSGSGSGSSSGGAVAPSRPAGGKPPAPQIHTDPGGVANDLTPIVRGSAPGADSVDVYANDHCAGSPIAKGSPADFSSGFQVSVAANVETTFTAVSIGAQRSNCSAAVTYTEDSTAPRTRVTMGPGVKTRRRFATFRFRDITADPPGTTFVCKVDKRKWRHCASPFRAKHLKRGRHTVKIRATDLAGNVERHPVKRRFRVVRRH